MSDPLVVAGWPSLQITRNVGEQGDDARPAIADCSL
jgi:hypothetical protein